MHSNLNRWIFLGSLSTVFIITLIFGYGTGYGNNILSAIGISAKSGNNKEVSPQVSLSVMVTDKVTPKKKVTDNSVTNISLLSPQVSPLISSNIIQRQLSYSVTPLPSDMVTSKLSPDVSPTPFPMDSTSPSQATPTPTQTVITAGSVVINEIAWMGTTFSANDEWIELYNPTDVSISLEGWTLNSITGTSSDPKINLSGNISAYGYVVLERTNDTTVSDIQASKIYTGALNDTGEALELRNKVGNLVDSVPKIENGWFAGDKNSRSSMERINALLSGSQTSNWATNNRNIKNSHDAGGNVIFGTPSSANSSK